MHDKGKHHDTKEVERKDNRKEHQKRKHVCTHEQGRPFASKFNYGLLELLDGVGVQTDEGLVQEEHG